MMGGGTAAHARIQANLIIALGIKLKGTGCRPYGYDMAARTHDMSVRYPDVTVYCGESNGVEQDQEKALTDPCVVIEVLSPSTAAHDQREKLGEYRELASVDTILFVDPEGKRVRVVQRTSEEGWSDNWLASGTDIAQPSLSVTLSPDDIFARD